MPPSRTQTSIRSNRPCRTSRVPFQDGEVIVRHEPRRLTPEERAELNGISKVYDGMEVSVLFRQNYTGMEQPQYSELPDPALKPRDPRPPPLLLRDFECMQTLGEGESCRVLLTRTVRDEHELDRPGTLLAMKTIPKRWLRRMDHSDWLVPEKDKERSVLTELPWNPFVTNLIGTFVDSRNCYMALEFMYSGSLRDMIDEFGPLSTAAVQFLFCGIAAGLGFLHHHDIMHRDVKPENILIGPGGYPVLVDFGCARRMREDFPKENGDVPLLIEWEPVGGLPYTPPEMVDAEDADEEMKSVFFGPVVDWWAAGCIVFELTTGQMAFNGNSRASCKRRIRTGTVSWPQDIRAGNTLKAFVRALLQPNPRERLGIFGIQQIIDHPWLRNVNWAKIVAREYVNPMDLPVKYVAKSWHTNPLPKQTTVPGLPVAKPDVYLRHDKRFRAKPSQMA